MCSSITSQTSTLMVSRFSWRCGIPLVRKTTIVSSPSHIPALTSSLFASRSTLQTHSITYRRRCTACHCTAGCCHVYWISYIFKWIYKVTHFCSGLPIILIGCKKDLRHDPKTINELSKTNQRPTTPDEVCLFSALLQDSAFHTRISTVANTLYFLGHGRRFEHWRSELLRVFCFNERGCSWGVPTRSSCSPHPAFRQEAPLRGVVNYPYYGEREGF